MLISFRHNFIFLANPRCGSSSIRRALQRYADVKARLPDGLHPHSCLRTVESFLRQNSDRALDSFSIFTTVRNPWERAVSIYHFGLRRPGSIWHAPVKEAGSFRSFCDHGILDWVFNPRPGQEPCQEGPFDAVSFCSDLSGTFRGEVFDLYQMDALQERLREIGVLVTIPHLKKTEHDAYATYYDRSARERIGALFDKDVALMGYEF